MLCVAVYKCAGLLYMYVCLCVVCVLVIVRLTMHASMCVCCVCMYKCAECLCMYVCECMYKCKCKRECKCEFAFTNMSMSVNVRRVCWGIRVCSSCAFVLHFSLPTYMLLRCIRCVPCLRPCSNTLIPLTTIPYKAWLLLLACVLPFGWAGFNSFPSLKCA